MTPWRLGHGRVRPDTLVRNPHSTRCASILWALLGLAALAHPAGAEPRAIDAVPIWLIEDRVYVVSRDTTRFELGDLLVFLNRDRMVAAGQVSQIVDRGLVQVTIAAGSLAGIERLDRVSVQFERPMSRAVPTLRIGFPSRRRSNLLFKCSPVVAPLPEPAPAYRVEAEDAHGLRLLRPAGVATAWPETLIVRFFDQAGDEEIALERADLDLAVFWPGEWSSRARAVAGAEQPPTGRLARGAVAALHDAAGGADWSVGDSVFALLDRGLFQGDLVPWPSAPPDSTVGSGVPGPRAPRFDAADLPGRVVIERLLSRSFVPAGRDSAAAGGAAPALRLLYLDAASADVDSLLLAAARRAEAKSRTPQIRAAAVALRAGRAGAADSLGLEQRARAWDDLQMRPLFAIHCPVVARPEARGHLSRLGADAIVNLIRCDERAGR